MEGRVLGVSSCYLSHKNLPADHHHGNTPLIGVSWCRSVRKFDLDQVPRVSESRSPNRTDGSDVGLFLNRDKTGDLQYVRDYKPERDDISCLRVLLYGPVGAGKSSFISSVSNVIRGKMTASALANATNSVSSFTKKVRELYLSRS